MDPNPKQQVSEQLKNAKSILVTTSNNPSVDDIASVMGLTQLLQAMKKHASAVVSSPTPEALKFLNPDDIIEASTDKLRDFVVSFDKEKADKLRYKVEDDQVKIFITPYKTVITKDDFMFTQGDFHVDTIVVINATKRNELDEAVLKHSRILHEAEIVTINAGSDKQSNMGSINWHEESASSVSELLVSISEALGSGLLNKDSAQALLTGIVASTNMFSNTATSPKVMTMAAQLMAAGADQQLIMKKLKDAQEISEHAQELKTQQSPENQTAPTPREKEAQEDDVMLDLASTRQTEAAEKQKEPAQKEQPVPTEETPEKKASQTQSKSEAPNKSAGSSSDHKIITEKKTTARPPLEHHEQQFKQSVNSQPATGGASVNAPQAPQPEPKTQPQPQPQPQQQSSKLPEPPQPKAAKQQTQAPQTQPQSEAHVNVHPELPTLSKPKQQTPPQAASPKPAEPAPAKPQEEQATGNAQAKNGGEAEIDAARKAVQEAIANQPSPLPTPNQSMNSKEVSPQQGSGDIYIDHEGNIKDQNKQQ